MDSDWGSDRDDRKSCTGYVTMLANGPVSWKSRKQKSVALSTMEAEYMALSEVTKEIIHQRQMLKEVGVEHLVKGPTLIYCDNQSAIRLAKDSVHHDRSKHVDIRYHYTRDMQREGRIEIKYLSTSEMAADILTKGLSKIKHDHCVRILKLKF